MAPSAVYTLNSVGGANAGRRVATSYLVERVSDHALVIVVLLSDSLTTLAEEDDEGRSCEHRESHEDTESQAEADYRAVGAICSVLLAGWVRVSTSA